MADSLKRRSLDCSQKRHSNDQFLCKKPKFLRELKIKLQKQGTEQNLNSTRRTSMNITMQYPGLGKGLRHPQIIQETVPGSEGLITE